MKKIAAPLLFVLIIVPVLFSGCGRKDGNGGLEAAIVEKADFVCRLDYQSMKGSPMADYLEERSKGETETGSGGAFLERLEDATGIKEGDIVGMIISGSLEGVDFDAENPLESAEELDIAMGLTLGSALTEDRFRSGIELLVDESGTVDLQSDTKGERTIYRVVSRKAEEPTVFTALSAGGRAVYAAFSAKSLDATLAREGRGGALSKELQAADSVLPDGSQVRYAFVMPTALRTKVADRIAEMQAGAAENPTLGMLYGFVKPFRNLAALSLGVRFSENMDVSIFADLGTDEDALQAATLIQTMAVPFVMSQLARSGGGTMKDYADRMTVGSEGRNLSLALSLSESDLTALQLAQR